MKRPFVRHTAAFVTATTMVTAGIALNLSILSNAHWGPGGLSLGASGERAAAAATPTKTTPKDSSTMPTSTRRSKSRPEQATTTLGSAKPRPFSTRITPPATEPTAAQPPIHIEPKTTTKPKTPTTQPSETTTETFETTTTNGSTYSKHIVKINPLLAIIVTAISADRVTVTLAPTTHGWTAPALPKSGHDISIVLSNGRDRIEFRAWFDNGKLHTAFHRILQDS